MKITYYGHSALLVETEEVKVIIDPFCREIRIRGSHPMSFRSMLFCSPTDIPIILEMRWRLPRRMTVRSLLSMNWQNIAASKVRRSNT